MRMCYTQKAKKLRVADLLSFRVVFMQRPRLRSYTEQPITQSSTLCVIETLFI